MMSAEPASTGARVLREILRTPAYREILRLHLTDRGGDDPGAAAKILLTEDPELPLRVASASPAAIDAAASSALALGRQLNAYPDPIWNAYLDRIVGDIDTGVLQELPRTWGPILARSAPWLLSATAAAAESLARSLTDLDDDERARLTAAWASKLDGADLGRAVNAWASMVVALRRIDGPPPAAATIAEAAVRSTDFGLVRQSIEALSAGGRQAGLALTRAAVTDPTVVANVLVAVPPVLNDLLGTAADTLDELDLPDEILASAVLNLLGRIHAADLGRIATGLARTIDAIHGGSAVLGDTEPALRGTAAELIDALSSTLDGDAVGRALVALGEDGETLAGVLADVLRQRPALMGDLAGMAVASQAPLLRGATTVLREANALPDDAFSHLGARLRDNLDPVAAVLAARELLVFVDRYLEANPGGEAGRRLVEIARRERLDEAASSLLGTVADQVLDAIDPELLEGDWESLLEAARRWLEANPGLARAIFRPLVRAGMSTVRERIGEQLERRQPRLPRLRRLRREGRRFRWSS